MWMRCLKVLQYPNCEMCSYQFCLSKIEIITISGYQFLSWPIYLHNLSIVWLHRSLMLNADFCDTLCTWTRTIQVSSTCIYSVCVRVECESYISSHVNISSSLYLVNHTFLLSLLRCLDTFQRGHTLLDSKFLAYFDMPLIDILCACDEKGYMAERL